MASLHSNWGTPGRTNHQLEYPARKTPGYYHFLADGSLIFSIASGSELFDGQEDAKDRATLAMEGAAPKLNPSTVVVNYLFDNPET